MVRAWYIDDSDLDQRQQHQLDPPQFVNLDFLKTLGILYWKLDADNLEGEGVTEKLSKDHGYICEDVITLGSALPDYEEDVKLCFTEHMHSDKEIRLLLEGSGYFDVRSKDDKWVRIEMEKGVLIALPPGLYHRFTLDTKNYVKAMRLFVGKPVWTPINRPAEDHPKRIEYMQQLGIN